MNALKNKLLWLTVASLTVIALLGGCASLFRGTVTLTAAVDSASKEYARIYNDGLVSTTLDAKVEAAHAQYRKACGTARDALVAYELSGDPTQYNLAFEAARSAANSFITLIWPLLEGSKARSIQTKIANAHTL